MKTWPVLQRTSRQQHRILFNLCGAHSRSTSIKLSRNESLVNSPLALHTNPCINGKTRRRIQRKQRSHKKSRRTGLEKNEDRYKRLQHDVQYQIRFAHKTYMKEAVSNSLKDNPRKFWPNIKNKGQGDTGFSPLKNRMVSSRVTARAKQKP